MQAIDEPKEFDSDKHGVYSREITKLLIAAGADVYRRDNTRIGHCPWRGSAVTTIWRPRLFEPGRSHNLLLTFDNNRYMIVV